MEKALILNDCIKKTLFLLILLFSSNLILGQTVRVFDGVIDKYPIQMFLNYDSARVDGYYFYKKFGKPIQISGEFSGKLLKLSELNDINGSRESATEGQFILNENYNGIWKTEDKELKVSLKEIYFPVKWMNFKQKVELTHTINNRKHTYPIEISTEIPDEEKNQKLMNLIVPKILGITGESCSSVWDYFNRYVIKYYSEYLKDLSDQYMPYFSINMRGTVVNITDSILNYKTSETVYQGGVHGYCYEFYYIFDLQQMKGLNFEDIFKPDSKPYIAKLLYEQDNNKEHKLEEFEEHLGNIYMTNKGVGFFFNPYELDCYACGTFNFFLNFSELQGLLKE